MSLDAPALPLQRYQILNISTGRLTSNQEGMNRAEQDLAPAAVACGNGRSFLSIRR